MNGKLDLDPMVLAKLIAARWTENRSYYTLKQRVGGVWLEGAWERRPHQGPLALHWSRATHGAEPGFSPDDQP